MSPLLKLGMQTHRLCPELRGFPQYWRMLVRRISTWYLQSARAHVTAVPTRLVAVSREGVRSEVFRTTKIQHNLQDHDLNQCRWASRLTELSLPNAKRKNREHGSWGNRRELKSVKFTYSILCSFHDRIWGQRNAVMWHTSPNTTVRWPYWHRWERFSRSKPATPAHVITSDNLQRLPSSATLIPNFCTSSAV
jgi:hypothetical protein